MNFEAFMAPQHLHVRTIIAYGPSTDLQPRRSALPIKQAMSSNTTV